MSTFVFSQVNKGAKVDKVSLDAAFKSTRSDDCGPYIHLS
jgi:hypothetical protein